MHDFGNVGRLSNTPFMYLFTIGNLPKVVLSKGLMKVESALLALLIEWKLAPSLYSWDKKSSAWSIFGLNGSMEFSQKLNHFFKAGSYCFWVDPLQLFIIMLVVVTDIPCFKYWSLRQRKLSVSVFSRVDAAAEGLLEGPGLVVLV